MKILIFYFAVFLTALAANAQVVTKKLPDSLYTYDFEASNYTSQKLNLSEFKGKVIILDFWATWCTSCIAEFPKEDSLQRKFQNDLQFVLVNSKKSAVKIEDRNIIDNFFARYKKRYSTFSLPSIILESVISDLFPHRSIPHYVWIDKSGSVVAETSAKYITEENIKKVIEGKKFVFVKPIFNPLIPLFNNFTYDELPNKMFTSTLTGYVESLSFGKSNSDIPEINYIGFRNQTILDLLNYCSRIVQFNKVVMEVADTSRFDMVDSEDWSQKNRYCYELSTPASISREQRSKFMLEDLHRYFGVTLRKEKRMVKCVSLIAGSRSLKLLSKKLPATEDLSEKDISYEGVTIEELLNTLNMNQGLPVTGLPIVINGTDITFRVNLVIPKTGIRNIPTLKLALKKYDLDLVETEQEQEMFIITEDGYQKNKNN